VTAAVDNAGDRYEIDLVMRCIGVGPTIGFLEDSGVKCDTGVLVDECMRTSDPDVFAAGDCAEITFPGAERTTIQKLWYTAIPMGWIAGEMMAGGECRYEKATPYGSAMFMDLDFCSYGEVPAPWNDLEEHNIEAPNGLDCLRLVHEDDRIVGATFLGTGLTKEDLEHIVESAMTLQDAIASVQSVFGDAVYDRAPRTRIAEPRTLSRRPRFWPFGPQKTWRQDCL
jgi:NAD(P)H-nitrite reductase large subunit